MHGYVIAEPAELACQGLVGCGLLPDRGSAHHTLLFFAAAWKVAPHVISSADAYSGVTLLVPCSWTIGLRCALGLSQPRCPNGQRTVIKDV
jgi:hypothetical protein